MAILENMSLVKKGNLMKKRRANGRFLSLLDIGSRSALILSLVLGGGAVRAAYANPPELLATPIAVTLNPSGIAPLTAVIDFTTTRDSLVQIAVQGAVPVAHTDTVIGKTHSIPILGLYPGRVNSVVVTISSPRIPPETQTLQIQTNPLPAFFPSIAVTTMNAGLMEPGLNLSTLLLTNGTSLLTYPIMFDAFGEVRWYLDLSALGGPCLPFRRIKDGNFVFGLGHSIYEYDIMGRLANKITVPGFTFHDEIIELPNGNFVAAVDRPGTIIGNQWGLIPSRGDVMIEVNPKSGAVVTEWDLLSLMDVDRLQEIGIGQDGDWFHMNGIAYRPSDDSFIVSGRNQAVCRVTHDGKLKWILAADRGWETAGWPDTDVSLLDFILWAFTLDGQAYHLDVQTGYVADPTFDWPWQQSSPVLLANGNLFLLDNGYLRFYLDRPPTYSRAVEYNINDAGLSVRQVWQYGLERGADLYSPLFGSVDELPLTHNRLLATGMDQGAGGSYAKVVEVTYPGKAVVFEAVLQFKKAPSPALTFGQYDIVHRTVRTSLYLVEPVFRIGN
jgi:arylsulfate sulfotransferase